MLKFCKAEFVQKIFLVPIFSILIFSCSIINFEELKINSNIDEKNIYFNEEKILLNFSIQIEKDSLEQILILKQNSERVEIILEQNKNLFFVKPKLGWKINSNYDLAIHGSLKTFDNRNYEINFKKNFYYGNGKENFFIESIEIPKTKTDALIFNFNRKIDLSEFEKNFSISPFLKISKKYFNDDKTVKIIPENFWQANTFFTFNVKQFFSSDKIELDKNYSETFLPNSDFEIPQIIKIEAAKNVDEFTKNFTPTEIKNIKITDSVAFNFNKEIDVASFENSFSIQPKIQGAFIKNQNTIIFKPNKNFDINTPYSISIKKTCKDLNELNFYNDYNFEFLPTNEFLKIKSLGINTTQNLKLFSDINKIDFENIPEIDFSSIKKLFVKIDFSQNIKNESKKNLENIFSIEVFFPQTLSSPKLEKIDWISDTEAVLQFANFSFSESENYYYKLKISNSKDIFISQNDEYLEENLCTIFKTK